MKEPLYEADRSLTLYVTAEREEQTVAHTTEGALTAWAVLALTLVVLGIMIGGCA
jgi:type III secretory pathway component EscT